ASVTLKVLPSGFELPASVESGSFAVSDVPLTEGANTLTVTATDRLGHRTTTPPQTVTLDTSRPFVEITSPDPNSVLGASPVLVRGRVDDPTLVSVKVNGIVASVATGEFSASVPLAEEIGRASCRG